MLKFGEYTSCVKCGCKILTLRWNTAAIKVLKEYDIPETLDYTCKRCGYIESTECLDHKEEKEYIQ